MDLATLIGILFGAACLIWGMYDGGDPSSFWSLSSLAVTFGGGVASSIIAFTLEDIKNVFRALPKLIKRENQSPYHIIQMLVEMSQKARREGLLALESNQEEIEDNYLRKALELVVDGVEPEIIRDSMQLELDNMSIRHGKGIAFFKTLAAEFPAWGMIGTMLGLINLLKSLDDPSKIGAAMSLALVTTFYGSVLANWICLPIATKLEELSTEEIRIKEMIIEGVLSIQSGENPRIMEHRLKTFLSPEQRKDYERLIAGNEANANRVQ
ncbi:MAG: motility protein A [Clostridiaceae bacterium]|nr:motility protein A [Clostridiaceae bacterium]